MSQSKIVWRRKILQGKKIRHVILYILSIILVVSNLGIITNNQLRKGILYLAFALLILIYFIMSRCVIEKKFAALSVVSFAIVAYLLIIKKFSPSADRVIFMIMDLGMIWIGIGISKYEDGDFINRLFCCYVITCVVSGIYYLFKFDTSLIYGYDLKHCLASNILMAFIILIMGYSKFPKPVWGVSFIVLIITIFNLNSRSTIIGLIVTFVLLIIVEWKHICDFLSRRKYLGIIIIGIPTIIIISGKIMNRIKLALRLDTLSTIGISRYSADRISMIKQGFEYYNGNELFGIANKNIAPQNFYIECFPLDILVQIGIIGFILYCIWFIIIWKRCFGKEIVLGSRSLAKVIIFVLWIIGLFSANAPMGPGTAYSFGWLIVGMYWIQDNYLKNK